jgi:hypothetical protein
MELSKDKVVRNLTEMKRQLEVERDAFMRKPRTSDYDKANARVQFNEKIESLKLAIEAYYRAHPVRHAS